MNFRLATSTMEWLLEVPYLPPIPGSTPGDYNLDQLPKYPWCQRFLFSYLSKLISAAKSMNSKAVTLASHQEKKALRTRVTGVTSLMSIQILDHNNIISPNGFWSWFIYYVVFITLNADFNLTWPCDEYNGLSRFQITRDWEGFYN